MRRDSTEIPAPGSAPLPPCELRAGAPERSGRRRVLFYGDSNTYGTNPAQGRAGRYPEEVRWTGRLSRALEGEWTVLEDSGPGRCIPELDFERARLFESLRSHAPLDLLAVMLGTNDHLSLGRPDCGAVGAKMARFLRDLRREDSPLPPGTPVLVIAPPYLDFHADRWYRPYDTRNGSLSRALGRAAEERLTEDRNLRFLDAGGWDLPLCGDGIHLSAEGHRILAERLAAYFQSGDL